MIDLSPIYSLIGALPFLCLKDHFMQQAFLGLLLLAPMAAAMGVQVVNLRMAFFSDAVSHSAFAGVGLGLVLALEPGWTMVGFGVVVGLGITWLLRRSTLSTDTVTGVFFSGVVAFGLALVSRDRGAARDVQRFLYGDILTVGDPEILKLAALFCVVLLFQVFAYNRMLYLGISQTLAKAHRVKVALYQYVFAGILSLVVMYSVRAVGVLLVTALLVVPAATARNAARTSGGMFRWAVLASVISAVAGLLISAQEWAGTATGATVVLVSCLLFLLSLLAPLSSRQRAGS